jgi:hypothetical protein
MFRVRDTQTPELFDRWGHLGPSRRRLLDRSWAGLFRKGVLPALPVEKIIPAFHASTGRPSKEINTVLGALIFQQMFDLTDDDTVAQLAFSLQWHYALDLCGESDNVKYVCSRTLFTMRHLLTEKGIDKVLFDTVTSKMVGDFGVSTEKQRLDSVHITSNMRRLGRVGLFARVITSFLKNLKRREPDLFAALPAFFGERYLPAKGNAVFSMVKPSESARTLSMLAEDLFVLVRRFEANAAVGTMKSFDLLKRTFSDQCNMQPETGQEAVEVKPAKEVKSTSLQNPSDPDAGFSGHKGQGFAAQVIETYHPVSEGEAAPLRVITGIDVHSAAQSDAHALLPAITVAQANGLSPKEVLADTAYGSDQNVMAAAEKGVEVVSPVMGSTNEDEDAVTLADFSFSEDETLLACPQGHAPISFKRAGKNRTVVFANMDCIGCPRKNKCLIKPVKKGYGLTYTDRVVRIAKRRAGQKTAAFKDRYRWRSGVESTMSSFDRLTGVKHLRVRGIANVRYAVVLKALGVNLFRVAAWMVKNGRNPYKTSPIMPGVMALLRLHAAFWSMVASWITETAPVHPGWQRSPSWAK